MNSITQESPVVITLTMLAGLITFILVMMVICLAIYTLLQTGQSILGEMTVTLMGWPHP